MATEQTDRELLLALMRNPGVIPNLDPFTYPQNAPNVPKEFGQEVLEFAQALERNPNRRATGLEEVVELIGKMGVINPLKTAGSLMQLDKPTVERMAQSGVEAAKRAYDDPSGTASRLAQGAKEALLDPVGTAGELSVSDVAGGSGLLSKLAGGSSLTGPALMAAMVPGSDVPRPKRSESMGFKDPNKFGTLEEPTPFSEQDYPYTESVVVEFPDGDTFVDQVKGLNSGHALERAKINFDGAKVRKATRSEELMQEQLDRKEASGSLDYVERYKLERKQLNAPKQTDLKQFFVEQGGVRVPLPDKNFGVGKKIGNDLYVHKSAEDVIPVDILNNARRLIGDFPYDVVKYNKKDNSISFIESPDFDTSPEPIIGNSIKVNADGSVSKPRKGGNVIYHHKWNMVRPDYDGFDYNQSMLRSAQWTSTLEGTGINRNKIGNKNYWDSNVLPLLGE